MSDKKLKELVHQLLEVDTLINEEFPHILGQEAVNHYTENFDNQSFDGEKWPEVKRRDPDSTWYGFKKGARQKLPSDHPKRKGSKKPYKRRKANSKTHFARVATKSPILSSTRSVLENSLYYEASTGQVNIKSNKPYAEVQNSGGTIKVFGKKSVKLKPRPFVGESQPLNQQVQKKMIEKTKKHFKR